MEKLSVFVDGANMYYAQKRLGWFIDFRRALSWYRAHLDADVTEAFYYSASDPGGRVRDLSFHDYLMYSGYTVRLRSLKQTIDEATGEIVERVDLGVELVVDMLNSAPQYSACVLMSGDGSFERALETLRCQGKRILVVAHPDMTARELRNVAGSNFIDLRELETHIARTDRAPECEHEPEESRTYVHTLA